MEKIAIRAEGTYPKDGSWQENAGGKNIAAKLEGLTDQNLNEYTITIETDQPSELKLDGWDMKTKKDETGHCVATLHRTGTPIARRIRELRFPEGVKFRVSWSGYGEEVRR